MGSLGLALTSIAASRPTPSLASSSSLALSNNKSLASLHSSDSLETSRASFRLEISDHRRLPAELRWKMSAATRSGPVAAVAKPEPLKIMISGAPASGKGTQCELIKKKVI